MRYAKGSEDYLANLEGMHEMEEDIPMTRFERARLRSWVKDGHDIESNPWDSWEFEVPWKWDLSGRFLIENDTLTK